MQKYKETGYKTLFDDENRHEKLSKIGNPLEKLSKVVDFEMFRSDLEEAVLNKDKKSKVGAKPYDVVMMFKIMVIQRYYNLSDDQTEYQIEDRVSFRRFLGLSSGDKVPDAKTDIYSPILQQSIAKQSNWLENYGPSIIQKMNNGTAIPAPWARDFKGWHYDHVHFSVKRH